ncbi:MAG: protein kinase domain-containing protein [Parachlamydiaceae bacterium]
MTAEKFPSKKTQRFQCKKCLQQFSIVSAAKPRFCPICNTPLDHEPEEPDTVSEGGISLVEGHEPSPEAVQFSLGPYKILKVIGQGGMGEVLLAYDTICGRKLALKRIRTDLTKIEPIKNRFLKEARVTSQLTHPSIIPIYTIHQEDSTYYTMPYVEGETLKQILRKSRQKEKEGERVDLSEGSIPTLLRIYLTICQAVAYAHSKSVLHRDLKPENIIIGKYGEVMILDWGLAKLEYSLATDDDLPEECVGKSHPLHQITKIGKVVGTISHMAPERALGAQATKETDIYSLGVILFQILTLKLPFKRKTLKEYRPVAGTETVPNPIEVAPYRDIPKVLAAITMKCLSNDPKERFHSVDQLIHNLQNYIEGRSEWFLARDLSPHNAEDWEFQENILIAEHTAITRHAEIVEWAQMMISKESFAASIRIEADICLKEGSQGIGILFNIPEQMERKEINEGYCLWLGTKDGVPSKLLRASVEVMPAHDVHLTEGKKHAIVLEKVDNSIRCWIDGIQQISYISRMPLIGTHVGLLSRDANYECDQMKVYVGSQNINVNCLAVPDAFLANKDYNMALSEYRRIANVFSGHAEGREAILRAGICLIEQAKANEDPEHYFNLALQEFEKLHETAGAPLEYLGKALTYETQKETEEEIKCFELAFRRYPKHPLLHVLKEQALFRLIESSSEERKATYLFLLFALQNFPQALKSASFLKLIESLKKHWEPLIWFLPSREPSLEEEELKLHLAFWTNKPYALLDVAKATDNSSIKLNAIYFMAVLGHLEEAKELVDEFEEPLKKWAAPLFLELKPSHFPTLIDSPEARRLAKFLYRRAFEQNHPEWVLEQIEKTTDGDFLPEKICALLSLKKFDEAGAEFQKIPLEKLIEESNYLHFLYGLWLYVTEGEEIAKAHWTSLHDAFFPRTYNLCTQYLMGRLDPRWENQAFDYERMQLSKQLKLFHRLIN